MKTDGIRIPSRNIKQWYKKVIGIREKVREKKKTEEKKREIEA